MSETVLQYLFVLIFFVLPGGIGAWTAYTKGRTWPLWLVLCFLFPPTLVVALFQSPAREVAGHYRKCPKCGEYSKWRETACRFCQTPLGG